MQRLASISLAARVSLAVAIGLWVLAAITWWVYSKDPSRVGWGSYMTVSRGGALIGMWAVCVAAVYGGIRTLMHDSPLGHSGVQKAWQSGSRLMASQGLRWHEVPCFLVLGNKPSVDDKNNSPRPDADTEKPTPLVEPNHCIDWSMQGDGLIADLVGLGSFEPPTQPLGQPPTTGQVFATSNQPTPNQTAPSPMATATLSVKNDDATDQSTTGDLEEQITAAVDQAETMIDQAIEETDLEAVRASAPSILRRNLPSSPIDSERGLRRQRGMMEFLQRLRRARQPFAGINGVLAVVPADMLRQDAVSDGDLIIQQARQLRRDLQLVRRECGLEAPVTLAIASQQYAFSLASPLSPNSSQPTPPGLHLHPGERWDPASLADVADRAVSAIVDRVDEEMMAEVLDGQDRPAAMARNQQRQRLAAECRAIRRGLRTFLSHAFPLNNETEDPTRLAGVYLEAMPCDLDAVNVGGILRAQQHALQWTPATRRQQRNRLIGNILLAISGVALLALAYWQWNVAMV